MVFYVWYFINEIGTRYFGTSINEFGTRYVGTTLNGSVTPYFGTTIREFCTSKSYSFSFQNFLHSITQRPAVTSEILSLLAVILKLGQLEFHTKLNLDGSQCCVVGPETGK